MHKLLIFVLCCCCGSLCWLLLCCLSSHDLILNWNQILCSSHWMFSKDLSFSLIRWFDGLFLVGESVLCKNLKSNHQMFSSLATQCLFSCKWSPHPNVMMSVLWLYYIPHGHSHCDLWPGITAAVFPSDSWIIYNIT